MRNGKTRRHALSTLSEAEWRAFDAAHPAPTFFARPGWAAAFRTVYPNFYDIEPLLVDAGPGDAILLPVVRCHGPAAFSPWCGRLAMPLGGYTCAMTPDGTVADGARTAAAIRVVGERSDAMSITPWPLHDDRVELSVALAEHETSVIDLCDGTEPAIAQFKGVARRMAGQAVRRGVTCAPDRSARGITAYMAMLEASARLRGQQECPIPRALVEAVLHYGGKDAELWFAFLGDERVAGGVVLYGSEELFFWTAAMRQEFGYLRPSNALNVALMRTASERGLRWYNLGSSEGLPGVKRFKHSLGAVTRLYSTYEFASRRYLAFRRLRNLIGRAPTAHSNATTAESGGSSAGGGEPVADAVPPSSAPPPVSASVLR